MSANYCPQCGHANREAAKFCGACGARLPAIVPPAAPTPVSPTERYAPSAPQAEEFQSAAPARVRPAPAARPPRSGNQGLSLGLNLLAWLAAAAAALLIILALPALSLSGRLLDGALYKEALRQENVYQRFPDLFADQMALSQAALGKEANIDFSGFTANDWKFIAQELVTPEWVQTQVERLIDEIFASAEAGGPPPSMKISLAEVMQTMSGEAGFRIYKQVIQPKRPCSLDDLFGMLDWLDEKPNGILRICRIPEGLADLMAFFADYETGDDLIRDLIKELPDQLPKELVLADFFTLPAGQAGRMLDLFRIAAGIGLGLAGLAMLLVFIAPQGRTLKGWLLLWGLPLGLAGLVCLGIALLAPTLLTGWITGGFRGDLTPALSTVLTSMSRAVVQPGARTLGLLGGGLLVIGGGLSGGGLLLFVGGRLRNR